MPSREVIVGYALSATRDFVPVAIAWHLVAGGALCAWLLGWRPSKRIAVAAMLVLLGSFGVVAAICHNPFNAVGAAVAIVALRLSARGIPDTPVEHGADAEVVLGWTMIAFGWAYPHFLEVASPAAYLYAAPLGVLPCPSLAMAVGVTLAAGGLGSRVWALVLAAFALFYGVLGVVYLHVWLDVILIGGALALAARSAMPREAAPAPAGSAS